ncbi:MAG: type I secretion C-terminal target domain-containing protein [Alphaproteobacteria bacterium]|nr:MAG: type I secretion C-terminal target domain-containing protein [Alphaproteobacteria bacterium]
MAISKVSFTNTPQAGDDNYTWNEDTLLQSNIYNSTTGFLTLDVMANDLGGKAKTLYSIDDGNGNALNPTDLLNGDNLVNGISAWELTASGNYARINSGKIELNLAPELGAGGIDSLGADDHFTDTFVYAIRLGNGTLSWAHVNIDIYGQNDIATISGTATGAVVEDTTITASGTLTVSDVDMGENELQPVAAGTAGDSGYGTFEVLANGQWTYTLDNASSVIQALPDGAILTDTLTVTSEDGTDTEVITITITGTNDVPTVAGALTAGAAEGDAAFTADLLAGASDVDTGETATLSVANVAYSVDGGAASATAPAGVSLSGATLTVDPSDAAFNHLAAGQTSRITVSYNVQDVHGATVAQTETITITGTNDVPTVASALADSVAEGDASFTADLLAGASDLDDGETATLSVVNATYSVDGGAASAIAPAGVSLSGVTLTVDPSDASFNHLGVGQSTTVVVSYDIEDAQGATVSQTETITITGTNDAPTVAAALTASATEGDPSFSVNLLSGVSDVDTGDTLGISDVTYSVNGGAASASAPAGLSLSGSSLTVDPTNAAFDPLNTGDHTTITISYTVDDGHGGSVAQTETITINGITDGPVGSSPIITAPDILYWTDNAGGIFSPINRISFQDADSATATVRVTLGMDDVVDSLVATSSSGVTIGGSGTSVMTLDGTIADINAFLYGGKVTWDPNGGSGQSGVLTVTIDDNGTLSGGNVVIETPINITSISPTFTGSGTGDSSNDFFSVNFTDIDTDPSGQPGGPSTDGNDVMTTSWSHQPLAGTAVVYNGGAVGTDTINIVMTPDQLAAALAVTADQDDLRAYFDGTPGGDTLGLSDSAWNADVTNFEVANIFLATGYGTGKVSINSFFDALPPLDATPDADTADDLVIGTAGSNVLSGGAGGAGGLNGDDVLVGLAGDDLLGGGSGSDLLLGGDGQDVLIGGIGADVLSGGRGGDTFFMTETLSIDAIIDYSFVEGDKLDLSALLDTNFGVGSNVADFARVTASGADLLVQVDVNGAVGGAVWTTVANLANYNTSSLDPVSLFFEGTNVTVTG